MGRNTSITLGDHFERFVDGQIADGRYGSASEVLRAALRLLEEQETQLARLRAALTVGEESGYATPFDFDNFLARKRSQHAK